MLLLRVTLLLCYSSVASAQFGSQEGTLTRLASELRPAESNTSILSQLVLVIGAVRNDRIYLMWSGMPSSSIPLFTWSRRRSWRSAKAWV
jgi:hypothetical protein